MGSVLTIIKAFRYNLIDERTDVTDILNCDHNTRTGECPHCKTELPLLQFIPNANANTNTSTDTNTNVNVNVNITRPNMTQTKPIFDDAIQERTSLFSTQFTAVTDRQSLSSTPSTITHFDTMSLSNVSKISKNKDIGRNSNTHYIWTIGYNHYGQQGNGTTKSVSKLAIMSHLDTSNMLVNDISVNGHGSAMMLCNDPRSILLVFGDNKYGQLSIQRDIIQLLLEFWCRKCNILALNEVMDVLFIFIGDICCASKLLLPLMIYKEPIEYQFISNGIASHHRFIYTKDDRLFGMGCNTFCQLGIKKNVNVRNNNKDEIRNFMDGEIEYFKKNKIKLKHISCSYECTTFLSTKGKVYACGGPNRANITERICIKTKIVEISSGNYHSLALDANTHIWSWGNNSNGQLGHGEVVKTSRPKLIEVFLESRVQIEKISSGPAHNIAIDLNGKVISIFYI